MCQAERVYTCAYARFMTLVRGLEIEIVRRPGRLLFPLRCISFPIPSRFPSVQAVRGGHLLVMPIHIKTMPFGDGRHYVLSN